MLNKLDRYLLKSFIGPFAAILLIVIFILLLQFLWLYIDELVGKGLGLGVILEFLGCGATIMMPLSIPLASVLASMMTMGSLSENFELTAIKASGISLARVLAPLIAASFVISIGAFFIANNLVPMAYNKTYTLRDDILKTKSEIKIPTQTFYDGIEGYILRVERNDKKTGMMHGVMVYDHSAGKGNVSLAIADSAIIKLAKDKKSLSFTMFNGINYEETNSTSYRDTTRQLQRTSFDRQQMIIALEHYGFEQSQTGKFADQAKSMTLKDLVFDQDSVRTRLADTYQEHLRFLREDRTFNHYRQMDSSYMARHTSLYSISKLDSLSLEDKITAYGKAANKLNNYINMMSNFQRETDYPMDFLKQIDLEIYKKFAIALVVFLLFFIGAPIGALIRKGGLGVPAIVAILFFVLYYIIDIIGSKLARDGAIDPVSGAFIASYVLLPICIYFTYKAINDEAIFGNDNIKAMIRKIKLFFKERFHKTNIIYMGTPDFAVAPLQTLLDNGYKVSAVVTVPDKASGRGLQVNESAVKKFAVAHGIPVLQPEKMKDPSFIEQLKSYKPDIFVVVAFRLLPEEVFSIPRLGCFNLHAALLPQYRGAAPINWAVINGDRSTGVTSFLIDRGVDTGKILMREQYVIKPEDTAADVHDALMEMGSRVVLQTVEGLIEGNMEVRVQKSFIQGAEILRKAPKLTKELCHIDWNDSTRHIVNLIRGLSDYPAAYTGLVDANGKTVNLKIFKARAAGSGTPFARIYDGSMAPGTIVSDGRSYLAVAAADELVFLTDIQIAGKKRMPVEDFLRGFHEPETYKTDAGTSAAVIKAVHDSEITE